MSQPAEFDAAVALVRARHQPSLNTDHHGAPLCMTCGFRDSWPCAPARLADLVTTVNPPGSGQAP